MSSVKIVDATPNDALLITQCVIAAWQRFDFSNPIPIPDNYVSICRRQDTLYSYLHTRIALLDGKPVGALVSYPGTIYSEAQKRTWSVVNINTDNCEAECMIDEYYLDSMAILPEARGLKIGKLLIADAVSKAILSGFHKVALLVSKDRTKLKDYYKSLGFSENGESTLFDHTFIRLIKNTLFMHFVMWKFKGTEAERKESALWMKEHLESLRGRIPGLISIRVLIDQISTQQFDALLVTSFVSPEFLDSYKTNPEHLKISEHCKSIREDRVSFDSWASL